MFRLNIMEISEFEEYIHKTIVIPDIKLYVEQSFYGDLFESIHDEIYILLYILDITTDRYHVHILEKIINKEKIDINLYTEKHTEFIIKYNNNYSNDIAENIKQKFSCINDNDLNIYGNLKEELYKLKFNEIQKIMNNIIYNKFLACNFNCEMLNCYIYHGKIIKIVEQVYYDKSNERIRELNIENEKLENEYKELFNNDNNKKLNNIIEEKIENEMNDIDNIYSNYKEVENPTFNSDSDYDSDNDSDQNRYYKYEYGYICYKKNLK